VEKNTLFAILEECDCKGLGNYKPTKEIKVLIGTSSVVKEIVDIKVFDIRDDYVILILSTKVRVFVPYEWILMLAEHPPEEPRSE